jgi:hypothetical protein
VVDAVAKNSSVTAAGPVEEDGVGPVLSLVKAAGRPQGRARRRSRAGL